MLLLGSSELQLHLLLLDKGFANGDTNGNTREIRILELYTRRFVSIIEERFDLGLLEFPVETLGLLLNRFFFGKLAFCLLSKTISFSENSAE